MTATTATPAGATVGRLPPVARLNLRLRPGGEAAASKALGVPLPGRIGEGAASGPRAAWKLGPDEWLLHAPEAEETAITAAFAAIRGEVAHSLTVISDREVTLSVTGAGAAELLSTGCPIDLSRLAPGQAKRTLFDSVQVVLIRDSEDAFRLEVWRSFAPHVEDLLQLAARELASGF